MCRALLILISCFVAVLSCRVPDRAAYSPTVATVQFSPARCNCTAAETISRNLLKITGLIGRNLGSPSVHVIVLPEYGLIGGNVIANRSDAERFSMYLPAVGKHLPQHGCSCSETKIGVLCSLGRLAAKYDSVVVVQLVERVAYSNSTSRIYSTYMAVSASGYVLAKYRKYHLYGAESFYFDEPDPEATELRIPVGKSSEAFAGLQICFDLMFPRPRDWYFKKPSTDYALTSSEPQQVEPGQISTLLFSSWWVNRPPLLTAVQVQSGAARGLGVVLVAANTGAGPYFQGSGIYVPSGPGLRTARSSGLVEHSVSRFDAGGPASFVMSAEVPLAAGASVVDSGPLARQSSRIGCSSELQPSSPAVEARLAGSIPQTTPARLTACGPHLRVNLSSVFYSMRGEAALWHRAGGGMDRCSSIEVTGLGSSAPSLQNPADRAAASCNVSAIIQANASWNASALVAFRLDGYYNRFFNASLCGIVACSLSAPAPVAAAPFEDDGDSSWVTECLDPLEGSAGAGSFDWYLGAPLEDVRVQSVLPRGQAPWPQGAWSGGGAMLDDDVRWDVSKPYDSDAVKISEMHAAPHVNFSESSAATASVAGVGRQVYAVVMLGMESALDL